MRARHRAGAFVQGRLDRAASGQVVRAGGWWRGQHLAQLIGGCRRPQRFLPFNRQAGPPSLTAVNVPGDCVAVIPCWNEAGTIGEVVRRACRQVPLVWVVDDGSTDATARHAEAAGARVVRWAVNRGKGAALRAGLRAARARGATWAVTLDGDGQHPPECIPDFLECARRTRAALVVGNRFARPGAMPPTRRVVNRVMSRWLSRRAGRGFPDSQCGFRLLSLEVWERLSLHTEHFEFESELLLTFAAAGAGIEFVPVPVIPAGRPSRIRPGVDAVRWVLWWWSSRSGGLLRGAPAAVPRHA